MVQQQSFKLLEVLHTLDKEGKDAQHASRGIMLLYQMTARFDHLADLDELSRVVKEKASRAVLAKRLDALNQDMSETTCLLEADNFAQTAEEVSNADLAAQFRASKTVIETACQAVHAPMSR